MIHLQNWYNWSEAKDDYYMLFIKAWIPFNVWYHDKYYDSAICRTDEKQIAKIKCESNKIRSRIESLLDSESDEGIYFRKELTSLHFELKDHPLFDRNGEITFNRMWTESNTSTTSQHDYRTNRFSVMEMTRPDGQKEYKLEIVNKRTGHSVEAFTIPKRNLEVLQADATFQSLDDKKQEELIKCVSDILEKKPSNIVLECSNGRKPQRSLLIDSERKFYLSDDKVKVAKVIIQLLYQLRCLIFHGEIDPTDSYKNIYKHAYYIQALLNKELI